MRPGRLALALALLAGAAGAGEHSLLMAFLPEVPRTAGEAERIATAVAAPASLRRPEPFEANPGGAATVRVHDNADAFSLSSANMPFERELDFKVGNGLFRKLWVTARSSTQGSDGLGPL